MIKSKKGRLLVLIAFIIVLVISARHMACGCACGDPILGFKSSITGWTYPAFSDSVSDQGPCKCPCYIKYRFSIEIIALGMILLLLPRLKKVKSGKKQ